METFHTDGRTFDAFCNDPRLWDSGAVLDRFVATVNGLPVDPDRVSPCDRVTIHGGYVHGDFGTLSLRQCFYNWLQAS